MVMPQFDIMGFKTCVKRPLFISIQKDKPLGTFFVSRNTYKRGGFLLLYPHLFMKAHTNRMIKD